MRFINVYELKLTQIELFNFFHFIGVATNAFDLFYVAYLANIKRFLCLSNLSI